MPKTQYTLSAVLDYGGHHLAVEEEIEYFNATPDVLADLLLGVEAAYYPGAFQLTSLEWGDGQVVTDHRWEGTWLQIPLPAPLRPGDSIQLAIAYEIFIPSPAPSPTTRPVPFGYTAQQTNLVDWYPFVPPYLPGQGWLAHSPGYFGEHLAFEEADFDVAIRLADPRPDLIIAASAPLSVDGEWHRARHPAARNFALSISHQYQVFTETVGPVTVSSYVFPVHAAAGQAALKATADALALYNELFGPYPRTELSLVEADFLDGMEYDGMYFLSKGFYNLYQGTPGEYLIAIAAHETAHQWWYALVANDQALEPWLDEALCTYSERIFYERYYPDALDWWWDYRIDYYEPQGWVDGSIYAFGDAPQPYRAYRDAVYLNGAVFLEELRTQVGDPAFFAFLRSYADEGAHRIVTAEDFFTLLRRHTDSEIAPLLEQYFQ